jgi:CTP:phosphocholine cytidylyltransferase-like protein
MVLAVFKYYIYIETQEGALLTQEQFNELYTKQNYEKIMSYKVDNAIIMAAGFSSRFAPLSEVCPKALFPVRGEVLIERQIRQLQEAGISDIYVVVGYKKELFAYLEKKYGVHIVENKEYETRNNNSTLYAVTEHLKNSYICSSDNYFTENVFHSYEYCPYYSALYAEGATSEYCLSTDNDNRITQVTVGGADSWYMFGHVYFDRSFSETYVSYLEEEYNLPEIRQAYWEEIYMRHLDQLTLYQKPFQPGIIQEFDSLEDLKAFDSFYESHSQEELLTMLSDSVGKII